jgi:type I restriction enzyme R subunit
MFIIGGEQMSKKQKMSETGICMNYITPALERSGWDKQKQIRREYYFTDGQILVQGNLTTRGKKKFADYLLSYKNNIPVAIVEAKKNSKHLGSGIQQAIEYAKILDIPFAYSSNGDGFVEENLITGKNRRLKLDEFPSPEELWERYKQLKNIDSPEKEEIITEPYHYQVGGISPRYYQRIAVNRVIEAIANGRKKMLLLMATGTGKTYTAFQIIWRLWKSHKAKRILYLADRNILIDQSIVNDFQPFGTEIHKIQDRKIDTSYEIYMSLYHQLVGEGGEKIYEEFKPNFFDLIIIDEAHRSSAREDSQWRQILEYFDSAVQIGMTATPKETKEVSNIDYFGDPLYTYSLKDGIKDGFLAPYKVMRVGINVDYEGYRPTKGELDKYGNEIEDREYNIKDFDKKLVIDKRTGLIAKRITEFLKKTDRYSKTIVFCEDVEHASRMREALRNENSDIVKDNPKYIMRIVGEDKEGKAQLSNFIAVNKKFPTIAITSELMSTGVDAKMCKLIVIEKNINSQILFKQILGRGTRIREEDGKTHFTLMDFRNASRLFADPDFDGEPVQVDEFGSDEELPNTNTKYDEQEENSDEEGTSERTVKYYVDGREIEILNERVQYLDTNGKLIVESIKEYSKRHILEHYATLDTFIREWTDTDKKQAIIEELKSEGVLLDALREKSGKDLDDFDLIVHIAFDKEPLTKKERANNVKKRHYLNKYEGVARKVLEKLLEKYQDSQLKDFTDTKILKLHPFDKIATPQKIVKEFGSVNNYRKAVKELENELYA